MRGKLQPFSPYSHEWRTQPFVILREPLGDREDPGIRIFASAASNSNGLTMRVDLRLRPRWILTPRLTPGLRMTEGAEWLRKIRVPDPSAD